MADGAGVAAMRAGVTVEGGPRHPDDEHRGSAAGGTGARH